MGADPSTSAVLGPSPGAMSDPMSQSQSQAQPQSKSSASSDSQPAFTLPSLSLPKGGGAIRGIGEKAYSNAATGSASIAIPLPASGGRSDFRPQLSLKYDSGSGNGPFGFGWKLDLPHVTRRTDKGLPRYQDDGVGCDVFVLSGAEDLVPLFQRNRDGDIVETISGQPAYDRTSRDGYNIQRYAPRVEAGFTRVERWTRQSDGDTHWRTISSTNVTTIYGRDETSRISDKQLGRVFTWLTCESYDDKGNAMIFTYKPEDSAGIPSGLANEWNRSESTRAVNKYLKSIRYGNRVPNRESSWTATVPTSLADNSWMFEIVLDYGEHDLVVPDTRTPNVWLCRQDPSSTYRAAFEIRTYRLCQRVLMFHHIPEELGLTDYLTQSVEFSYDQNQVASFIDSILVSGFLWQDSPGSGVYVKSSLPPLQLEYSKVPDAARMAALFPQDVDHDSLANVPYGVDGSSYQWIDLDGEGTPGILSVQAGGLFYTANSSANNIVDVDGKVRPQPRFSSTQSVWTQPGLYLRPGGYQLLDLAADGHMDLVVTEPGVAGYYERKTDGTWDPFEYFLSGSNLPSSDPNVRYIDLNGDGYADILVSETDAFTWYPSLAKEGFGKAHTRAQLLDEEKGPRVVFSESFQSIFLADMSGDGLSDLVRIRNSDICYWPNMGYGVFGSKVTMDNAPCFDSIEQFDPRRVLLVDADGSGTSDIVYFNTKGVSVCLNQAGNGFEDPVLLQTFDDLDLHSTFVSAVDLLGTGTACICFSSQLPGDSGHSMRYVDLMAGQKPHLLTKIVNNMGAETRIQYAPSTQFYLQDKQAGNPWLTRLAFPVQCVQRLETIDWISKTRAVSRFEYHEGYYDGIEREFRGFAMVEQWDTEEIGTLQAGNATLFPELSDSDLDAASYIPPTYTKSWFHNGIFLDRSNYSRHLAAQYYNAGPSTELPDSVFPLSADFTADEVREAIRALKGSPLRTEVYSNDSDPVLSGVPLSIAESNYTIDIIQPRGKNSYAIIFSHARESLSFVSERKIRDGRLQHSMVVETDYYGNILKSLSITYGRSPGQSPLTVSEDISAQEKTYLSYKEVDVTNSVDTLDDFRLPVVSEQRSYELTGISPTDSSGRFLPGEFSKNDFSLLTTMTEIPYEQASNPSKKEKRLIGRSRVYYRQNNLAGFLPLRKIESLGIRGQSYTITFTPGMISQAYQRNSAALIADVPSTLGSLNKGAYVDLDKDGYWWVPSGRLYFSEDPIATTQQELSEAQMHFFLSKRETDIFNNSSTIDYDNKDLLPTATTNALGSVFSTVNDYRILQPMMMIEPNGNRRKVSIDALGCVIGVAVMGKASENLGDNLDNFNPDVTDDDLNRFFAAPKGPIAASLLGHATTRILYNRTRYWKGVTGGQSVDAALPIYSATLTRENHVSDQVPDLKIQVTIAYHNGVGQVLQTKSQAEPGPVGSLPMVNPRWIATGWTIVNNKGSPIRKYEPFFDVTHEFDGDTRAGVAVNLLRDPLNRVVVTLNPDHTWEKTIFDPWQSTMYDVNDTATISDARNDHDVGAYFKRLQTEDFQPSWYDARSQGQLGPDARAAAAKVLVHADTPIISYFDSLGHTFLKVVDNGSQGKYSSRVSLDVQGRRLASIDPKHRITARYEYNISGATIHQSNMDSGEKWTLPDAGGRAFLSWDSRDHQYRSEYDELNRVIKTYVKTTSDPEVLLSKSIYGESLPSPGTRNLRGMLYQSFDQAGAVTNNSYDFKGNLIDNQRQLWQVYKTPIDLGTDVPIEDQIYHTSSSYDALNRVFQAITPDNTKIQHFYNEASLLTHVRYNLRGALDEGNVSWTNSIDLINYDSRGRRTQVVYSSGAICTYTFDRLTFRLFRMLLKSGGKTLQDFNYTYDPIGNICSLQDNAQQAVFFRNTVVSPNTDYTYDPTYRLISASGREHLGQKNGRPNALTAPGGSDDFRSRLTSPGDANAMGRYTEKYTYDEVGNILTMAHAGSDPSVPNWTRKYFYNETSSLDGSKTNRISYTTVGNVQESYTHDVHGNMTSMPSLTTMQWDYNDQLQATSKQVVNTGTPETTFYIYDEHGGRVRKVTEGAAEQDPTKSSERIYIGAFYEVYRKYSVSSAGGSEPTLERETLHIIDNKQKIAMIETRTKGTDNFRAEMVRYSFGNHIGSVILELDDQARVISFEEYYPYGSTSFQAVDSQSDVQKRYRYSGKERDEENGLYYHGARYYACWLGRWTACDPQGEANGTNLFQFVNSNPVCLSDPTGLEPEFGQAYMFHRMEQEVSAMYNATADLASGVAKGSGELALGMAKASLLPPLALYETGEAIVDTYEKNGGGLHGAWKAVNVINPIAQTYDNFSAASDAWNKGDFSGTGRLAVHGTASAIGSVALIADGAGFVDGIVEAGLSRAPKVTPKAGVLSEIADTTAEINKKPAPSTPVEPVAPPAVTPEPVQPPAAPVAPAPPGEPVPPTAPQSAPAQQLNLTTLEDYNSFVPSVSLVRRNRETYKAPKDNTRARGIPERAYKEPRDLKDRISGKNAANQTPEEIASDKRLAELYGFEYGKVPDIQLGHIGTPHILLKPGDPFQVRNEPGWYNGGLKAAKEKALKQQQQAQGKFTRTVPPRRKKTE